MAHPCRTKSVGSTPLIFNQDQMTELREGKVN